MVEMTFEMTEEIEDRLNEIARRHDVPIGEAIRLGLCLLSIADREFGKGNRLAVVHEEGDKIEPVYVLDSVFC